MSDNTVSPGECSRTADGNNYASIYPPRKYVAEGCHDIGSGWENGIGEPRGVRNRAPSCTTRRRIPWQAEQMPTAENEGKCMEHFASYRGGGALGVRCTLQQHLHPLGRMWDAALHEGQLHRIGENRFTTHLQGGDNTHELEERYVPEQK
jgi:hypothetical protein